MLDDFKRLILSEATPEEISAELDRMIKEQIKARIKKITSSDDAAEEIKNREYAPEKIPAPRPVEIRRENIRYDSRPVPPLTADELAYVPNFCDSADSSDNAVRPDIIEKIEKMRELSQTFYNGYMLRCCAEIAIVKQGEFMADVSDDYGMAAFCAIERPIYGALSTNQLRTYFTWRTDVRRGVYSKVDMPYFVLYSYELLNKIGVISSADAFNRLINLWEHSHNYYPFLDRYMSRWLKDFYAYNRLENDFPNPEDFFPVKTDGARKIAGLVAAKKYDNMLPYLEKNSAYNIIGSIFYKGNSALINEALNPALTALDTFFSARGISMTDLLCGRLKKDFGWTPFVGAYVNCDRLEGFHACSISASERYCIKRTLPCLETFELAPFRGFIGYILKSVEMVLRRRTGFRYGLSVNLNAVYDDFSNREKLMSAAKEPEFADVISSAVGSWCDSKGLLERTKGRKKEKFVLEEELPANKKPSEPIKVEIDLDKLDKIRKDAEDIAKKLIVEEAPNDISHSEISEMTEEIEQDTFEQRTKQAFELCEECLKNSIDFSSFSEEWRQFAQSLEEVSLLLLKAVYAGEAEQFCRRQGILPEAAYEQINAAALETIGDCVIENGEIIPDYAEDIAEIVKLIP